MKGMSRCDGARVCPQHQGGEMRRQAGYSHPQLPSHLRPAWATREKPYLKNKKEEEEEDDDEETIQKDKLSFTYHCILIM